MTSEALKHIMIDPCKLENFCSTLLDNVKCCLVCKISIVLIVGEALKHIMTASCKLKNFSSTLLDITKFLPSTEKVIVLLPKDSECPGARFRKVNTPIRKGRNAGHPAESRVPLNKGPSSPRGLATLWTELLISVLHRGRYS